MKRLVVWVLLVGCDGGSNGVIEIDDLGTELGLVSCAKQFDCCTDAEIMQQYMGITFEGQPITTEDQCVAFTTAVFTTFAVATFKESLALGRIEYDGAAAADCVAAIDNLTCAQYSTGAIADMPSGCRPFVIPKVADGGGCTQDPECISQNCEGESRPLGGPNVDGMCKPMPAAGQPCDDNCPDGHYCGLDLSSSMDICQPVKADGEQCNVGDECVSDFCDMRMCATKPLTCDGL